MATGNGPEIVRLRNTSTGTIIRVSRETADRLQGYELVTDTKASASSASAKTTTEAPTEKRKYTRRTN